MPNINDFKAKLRGGGARANHFRVVCDTSNNTANVIDSNEFRADIFVKPNRSINFIQLQFVATRSGVAFEEVVGG